MAHLILEQVGSVNQQKVFHKKIHICQISYLRKVHQKNEFEPLVEAPTVSSTTQITQLKVSSMKHSVHKLMSARKIAIKL